VDEDEDNIDLEFKSDLTPDQGDSPNYFTARAYASGEITRYSVAMLEFYSDKMPRNEALGLLIESLSVSLGNLISLVKEDHQEETIESANQVIQIGLLAQSELIATMAYGQVGHA
jgi:hypothetical protein